MKNVKRIYTVFGISILIFTIFFIGLINILSPSRQCRRLKNIKDSDLTGRVINKYYDSDNHNYETLEIKRNNSSLKKYFTLDESGFYNYVQVGDSIIKPLNSIEIIVIRGNVKKTFLFNFGCNSVSADL